MPIAPSSRSNGFLVLIRGSVIARDGMTENWVCGGNSLTRVSRLSSRSRYRPRGSFGPPSSRTSFFGGGGKSKSPVFGVCIVLPRIRKL